MRATSLPAHLDCLIVGGGPVGGALALMLAGNGLQIGVVEARQHPGKDPRALAISQASAEVLTGLGIWPALAATAIERVHVSQQGAFGRVVLRNGDLNLPALGHVMPYAALAGAVHEQLNRHPAIHYLAGATVTQVQTLDAYAAITLQHEGEEVLVTSGLLTLADGGALLAQAGIRQHERDYHQHAILAELQVSPMQAGVAFERFAKDGPIALLPHGEGYTVVWTRPEHDPLDVRGMDDATFLNALAERIGDRAGQLLAVSPRLAFPLRLKWAASHSARRVAVVGNAAQTLHPVAGQGFNLGLRDARALAGVISATPPNALGDDAMLSRYASLRQRDSWATVGFTDSLIRLFELDLKPLRRLKLAGFLALDNLPPLRREFAARMVFGTP
ncbi:FAD-dependent monooxygenase [Chitinimonas sp. BJYL2]|uniref:FAD-dependent monooxygenase n=1 Tax=Chitinimonas sp. BJYL2 TaxID=2976696 RepID=UPI0022B39EA8|nr:FAD-dependent monooxygenase [Chitinimonas sp. BJYL2]